MDEAVIDWSLILGLLGFASGAVSGIVALYVRSEIAPIKENIEALEKDSEQRREHIVKLYELTRQIEIQIARGERR